MPSISASISYSCMPGRAARIAARCASAAMAMVVAQAGDLRRVLAQPQLVQHVAGVAQHRGAGAAARALRVRVADDAQRRRVERVVAAERQEHLRRLAEPARAAPSRASSSGCADVGAVVATAPSTPARGPTQMACSGSRGRTKSAKGFSAPGARTATASGSGKPVT